MATPCTSCTLRRSEYTYSLCNKCVQHLDKYYPISVVTDRETRTDILIDKLANDEDIESLHRFLHIMYPTMEDFIIGTEKVEFSSFKLIITIGYLRENREHLHSIHPY